MRSARKDGRLSNFSLHTPAVGRTTGAWVVRAQFEMSAGAYTVARTMNTYSIVNLAQHITRIHTSLRNIKFNRYRERLDEEGSTVGPAKLTKTEHSPVRNALHWFRDQTVCEKFCSKMLQKAVAEFFHVSEDGGVLPATSGREAMVMVLVTYSHKVCGLIFGT